MLKTGTKVKIKNKGIKFGLTHYLTVGSIGFILYQREARGNPDWEDRYEVDGVESGTQLSQTLHISSFKVIEEK